MKKRALVEDIFIHFAGQSSMHPHSFLVHFNIEDIKSTMKNFHRDNIIGVGGMGIFKRGFCQMDQLLL